MMFSDQDRLRPRQPSKHLPSHDSTQSWDPVVRGPPAAEKVALESCSCRPRGTTCTVSIRVARWLPINFHWPCITSERWRICMHVKKLRSWSYDQDVSLSTSTAHASHASMLTYRDPSRHVSDYTRPCQRPISLDHLNSLQGPVADSRHSNKPEPVKTETRKRISWSSSVLGGLARGGSVVLI